MTHSITHALVFAAACIFTTAAIFLFFYFKEIKTPFHIRRTSDGKLVMYVSMRYYGITYNNVIAKDDELHRFGIDPIEYSHLGIGQESDVYFQYDGEYLGITNH